MNDICMIDVLWEDNTAMVVNKPSGLLTTAARGIESLETRLQQFFVTRGHKSVDNASDKSVGNASDNASDKSVDNASDKSISNAGPAYFGLPHRIDRPVSGAVLVGKTRSATKHFCAQFQSRKIDKAYVAIVQGEVQPSHGRWEDWMRKIPDRAAAEIVAEGEPDAKAALLEYQVLGACGPLTCLLIRLHTGRTHQIRLQAATRGLPIVGDLQYGSQMPFGSQSLQARERPIALHARQIVFRHAKTGRATQVLAPVPPAWNTLNLGDEIYQRIDGAAWDHGTGLAKRVGVRRSG